jgi:hypothetical protein
MHSPIFSKEIFVAKIWLCCVFAALLVLSVNCSAQASHEAKKAAKDPARITDALREETPNDFLRVTFVSAGTSVTSLARPGALRAFATATAFYLPPLPLKEFPLYSGLVNDDTKTLVALRCRPAHPETVDATLATWPNLFHAIERDVHRDPAECAAVSGASEPELQAFCFAHAYTDPPGSTVPKTLASTFDYAAVAFDAQHTQLAGWLRSQYGVFPAFSGLGFSVKDSYYLDDQHPMSAQQMLAKSVSPEYVLRNLSLKDAGCSCISVAPYPGRAEDRLDPKFIAKAGGDGECRAVKSLTHAR